MVVDNFASNIDFSISFGNSGTSAGVPSTILNETFSVKNSKSFLPR